MTAEEYKIKESIRYGYSLKVAKAFAQVDEEQSEIRFAEAYHKAKVEAISDVDINYAVQYELEDALMGIKWFKEQLLEQL